MLNLDNEQLVPFKTIAKTSTGNKWLYLRPRDVGDSYKHEFLSMQSIDALYDDDDQDEMIHDSFSLGEKASFTIEGKFETDRDNEEIDIVAVMRKWQPREGELVIVHGPVFPLGSYAARWMINEPFVLGSVRVRERGSHNEQFELVIGGNLYVVHRRNIARRR